MAFVIMGGKIIDMEKVTFIEGDGHPIEAVASGEQPKDEMKYIIHFDNGESTAITLRGEYTPFRCYGDSLVRVDGGSMLHIC